LIGIYAETQHGLVFQNAAIQSAAGSRNTSGKGVGVLYELQMNNLTRILDWIPMARAEIMNWRRDIEPADRNSYGHSIMQPADLTLRQTRFARATRAIVCGNGRPLPIGGHRSFGMNKRYSVKLNMLRAIRLATVLLMVRALTGVSHAQDAAQKDSDVLYHKAQGILKTHCYRCHGQDGANEGGFNYILLRDKMVAGGKYLVPGQPGKSRLYQRMADESMPPEGEKPTPDIKDLQTIKAWIQAGCPVPAVAVEQRPHIKLSDIVRSMKDDLVKAQPRDRKNLRYFTITHLYNAGVSEDELQSFRHGLSKLINSLSWGRTIVIPKAIDPARTVFRIDLRDYQWTETTWNNVLARYPYGILPESAEAKSCCESTLSRLPVIRADWFVAAASVPPLYESILDLPATDGELEKQLRVSVADNYRQERVARAGFNGSGISQNNRLIERHATFFGSYWKSYDFEKSSGRGNLFTNPFGPGKQKNSFQHDGGEIIFSLPNGLQAFMITDATGARISKAPTSIVSDPRRPDRSVVNGLSCMSCHTQGIIPKEDQVREFVKINPNAFSAAERESIEAIYPSREVFAKLQKEDSDLYRAALAKTGGRVGKTEPILALVQRFEAPLDLAHAAAELDLQSESFVRNLDNSPKLARSLGVLKVKTGTMQRQAFTDVFLSVAVELKIGVALRRIAAPGDPKTVPSTGPIGPAYTVKLNASLNDLALSRDRDWLYLLDATANEIRRLSTRTFELDEAVVKLTEGTEQMRRSHDGRTLYTCAAPNGHDYYNRNKGGKFQVIDAETFKIRSTITTGFSPWDMAVTDKGLIFVSVGGGQSTSLPVIDSHKKEVVVEGLINLHHRQIIRVSPDQQRVYIARTDSSSPSMMGVPITAKMLSNRDTDKNGDGGGRFEILPDGKMLILNSGMVKKVANDKENDLKDLAGVVPHLCMATDVGSNRIFLATDKAEIKVYSYPDFEVLHTLKVGELVYRMAYDEKSGMLYCACSPKGLNGRLVTGVGDLKVYDVRELPGVGDLKENEFREVPMKKSEVPALPMNERPLSASEVEFAKTVNAVKAVGGKVMGNTRAFFTASKVTDSDLKDLTALKSLGFLALDKTQVTDVGMKEVGKFKFLQTLLLNDTQVTDTGLKELAGLKNLMYLHLDNTQVTDIGIKELRGNKKLLTLHLRNTKVTDEGVAELKKTAPSIRVVR